MSQSLYFTLHHIRKHIIPDCPYRVLVILTSMKLTPFRGENPEVGAVSIVPNMLLVRDWGRIQCAGLLRSQGSWAKCQNIRSGQLDLYDGAQTRLQGTFMARELSSMAVGGNGAMSCDRLNTWRDKSWVGNFLWKLVVQSIRRQK